MSYPLFLTNQTLYYSAQSNPVYLESKQHKLISS